MPLQKNNLDLAKNIASLLDVIQVLRDPVKGCAWDSKQTFSSIIPYTIEEAYEVADAINQGDMDDVKDELADLLFQIIFYAELGKEQGHFDFSEICQHLRVKLVRRHPQVFEKQANYSDDELRLLWDKIKAKEKIAKGKVSDSSLLANIPSGMAPLQRAQKIQKQCAKVGFDWETVPPVVDKIQEEIQEVLAELNALEVNQDDVEEEIGDLLFAVVNLARHAKVDAETALLKANTKFEGRFRQVEQYFVEAGRKMSESSLAEMEIAWQRVKQKGSQIQ